MATDKPDLTDLESGDVRGAFDEEDGGRTTTKGATSTADEKVELQPLHEKGDGQTNTFDVLTNDVSFATKVKLLLWKNVKIQIIRRPCACACKSCVPFFIMAIMGLFTLIPGLFCLFVCNISTSYINIQHICI